MVLLRFISTTLITFIALFPHINRACQGAVDIAKQLMKKAKTSTGLKVTVDILAGVYETGKKCGSFSINFSRAGITTLFLSSGNFGKLFLTEPLKKACVGRSAWLCGLMRPRSPSRARWRERPARGGPSKEPGHQSCDERHQDHHREYRWSNDADIEGDELDEYSGIIPDHRHSQGNKLCNSLRTLIVYLSVSEDKQFLFIAPAVSYVAASSQTYD